MVKRSLGYLLHGTAMTAAEQSKGRFMRAPDGHEGGNMGIADSAGAGDNTGNSGESGTPKEGEDNTSQTDPLKGFWDAKPEEDASGDDLEARKAASQQLGAELGGIIKQFQAPEVFTKETADAIADGDLSKINEQFQAYGEKMMQHQLGVTAKLIGTVLDRFSTEMESRIAAALGEKDSEVALETHFPLAKEPEFRPMVERVWKQALVKTKGNRTEAISLTRGMLEAFGNQTAGSLREAPRDSTAGINTPASKSLVADLLSRD